MSIFIQYEVLHTILKTHFYRPSTKLWEGNVFTRFCLFTGGPHMTIANDSLDLIVQCPTQPCIRHGTRAPKTLNKGTPRLALGLLLVTSGGHHWRPVQTCSLRTPSTGTDVWWPLKYVQLTNGRHVSYKNAFLFIYLSVSVSVSGCVNTP